MEWNKVWAWNGKFGHIRVYPNPGFCVIYNRTRYKWSKFYGYKKEHF